jgi:dolichol-phosphate mannosyltransferase
LLVDNGSTDNTGNLLKLLTKNIKENIKVISVPINKGYGYGILEGLKEAQGDILSWTHADLQTDLEDVLKGLEVYRANDGEVFVKGNRINRNKLDEFFTYGMQVIARILLNCKLNDINAQPKIFSRKFYENVVSGAPEDFSLDLYFLYRAHTDIKVKDFNVYFNKRIYGEAKGGGTLKGKWKLIKRTLSYMVELRKKLGIRMKVIVMELLKKNYILISYLVLIALFSYNTNIKLENKITSYNIDESLVVDQGIKSIELPGTQSLAVGESTRWFTRVFYPLGLNHMLSNAGGEGGSFYPNSKKIVGWRANEISDLAKSSPYGSYENFKNLPNNQDFLFYLRKLLSLLCIISFAGVAYLLSKKNFLTGLIYFLISLTNPLVKDMLLIFYTESSLIIIFNIIIIMFLKDSISENRLYLYLSFLFILSCFTKLTGVLYILPIIYILITKNKNWKKPLRIEIFLTLCFCFTILINYFALFNHGGHLPSNLLKLVNIYLSNIFHIKTGHGRTMAPGFSQLILIFKSIGVYIILSTLSFVYAVKSKYKYLGFTSLLYLTSILMISSISGASFFLERNLTIISVILTFILVANFSYIFKKVKDCKLIIGIYIISLFLISFNSINKLNIQKNFYLKYLKPSTKIALINVPNLNKNINFTKVKGVPAQFDFREDMEKISDNIKGYDYVIIRRINQNKHYTNFILPSYYNLKDRKGNYFVYEKK